MVYRYADVLLKKAEALNELGHPDQAAAPLNIVRHRAGLADVPTTLNQETMREKIIHERRMEPIPQTEMDSNNLMTQNPGY